MEVTYNEALAFVEAFNENIDGKGDVFEVIGSPETWRDGENPDGSGRTVTYYGQGDLDIDIPTAKFQYLNEYSPLNITEYFNNILNLPDDFINIPLDAWYEATKDMPEYLDDDTFSNYDTVVPNIYDSYGAEDVDDFVAKVYKVADELNQKVKAVSTAMKKAYTDMQNWIEKNISEGEKSMNDPIVPAMETLDAMIDVAEEAKAKIATEANPDKTIRALVKAFDEAIALSEETVGMRQQDIETVQSFADNIRNISRREFPSDIRSWSAKRLQKNDAILAIDTFIMAMQKSMKYWHDMSPSQRYKTTLNGMPNYKFGVGETVKIAQTGRIGKVLEIGKENGTGKQYYKVRINGVDSPKTFGRNELRKYSR